MDGSNSEPSAFRVREVLEIEGHQPVRAGGNGGRDHVPIAFVYCDAFDMRSDFAASNDCLPEVRAYQAGDSRCLGFAD